MDEKAQMNEARLTRANIEKLEQQTNPAAAQAETGAGAEARASPLHRSVSVADADAAPRVDDPASLSTLGQPAPSGMLLRQLT